MTTGFVNLVVALPCEAQPLVDHYAMTEVLSEDRNSHPHTLLKGGKRVDPFRIYRSEGLRLVVSGVGKSMAAAAVGYLFHFGGNQPDDAWLNLGIAGHADLSQGSIRIAHKITNCSSGDSWYPPLIFDLPCKSAEVFCVDNPETEFLHDGLYEMESASILSISTRFSTSELVHVVKVVSDNGAVPAHRIKRHQVQNLISDQLDCVVPIIDQLQRLSGKQKASQQSPPGFDDFLSRWHFTATQTHQLLRLLRRWSALHNNESPLAAVSELETSRAVISALAERIDKLTVNLKFS